MNDQFGQGAWKTLDLEETFTSLEIEREFHNPDSDEGAQLLLLRNKLVRYIRRILGLCTQYMFGENYRRLVQHLDNDDSIITFNWDLLLDQELLDQHGLIRQYGRFLRTVPLQFADSQLPGALAGGQGLFLKLHGSLNWFRCGNHKCQGSSQLAFIRNVQTCLSVIEGIGEVKCWQCGSIMNPIIIPPLLRKPISEDSIIRPAWGLARAVLETASRVVVIGFSAAPTDFYSAWLLRSTVGSREGVEVVIVNPSNQANADAHREFRRRMDSIFLRRDYDTSLCEFSEIGALFAANSS